MDQLDHINKESPPFADTLRYELADAKMLMEHRYVRKLKWASENHQPSGDILCTFDAAYGELIQDAEKPFWESHAKAITREMGAAQETKVALDL